jgi:hypothetical protein
MALATGVAASDFHGDEPAASAVPLSDRLTATQRGARRQPAHHAPATCPSRAPRWVAVKRENQINDFAFQADHNGMENLVRASSNVSS